MFLAIIGIIAVIVHPFAIFRKLADINTTGQEKQSYYEHQFFHIFFPLENHFITDKQH